MGAGRARSRYSELQAGVQLANRSGALNEIEYSEFAQTMQAFADNAGAMIELPDMLEVAARAKELDAFAGMHDAQLTVTLRANGVAWSPGYLQQVAGRHGFVPGAVSGRLVLPSGEDHAPALLMLTFDARAALSDEPELAAVREATLSLDVPQTPEAGRAVRRLAAGRPQAGRRHGRHAGRRPGPRGHAACLQRHRAGTHADVPRARSARPGGRVGLRAPVVQLSRVRGRRCSRRFVRANRRA